MITVVVAGGNHRASGSQTRRRTTSAAGLVCLCAIASRQAFTASSIGWAWPRLNLPHGLPPGQDEARIARRQAVAFLPSALRAVLVAVEGDDVEDDRAGGELFQQPGVRAAHQGLLAGELGQRLGKLALRAAPSRP